MKEKFLPWFLLFCALGLSGTAAYYSVVGLSIVFVGVALPVIIMGSFLEISKIAIATYFITIAILTILLFVPSLLSDFAMNSKFIIFRMKKIQLNSVKGA